jgi:hypothetical protein
MERAVLADALDTLEAEALDVVLGALRPILRDVTAGLKAEVPALAAGSVGTFLPRALVHEGPVVGLTAAVVDNLSDILTAWGQAVDDQVLAYYRRVYEAGGLAAVAQVQAGGKLIPDNPDVRALADEGAVRHLAQARNRFLTIGDKAWSEARATMLAGLEQGHSVDRIARNLRGAVELSEAQARMVARTEVVSAANAGAVNRVGLMGTQAPLFKQWLSTLDGRTRPSHVRADGRLVEKGERFRVGSAFLEYPGDPSGPPAEVINCRCTVLFTDKLRGELDGVEGRQEGGVTGDVADLDLDDLPDQVTAVPDVYPGGLSQKQAEAWMLERHGSDEVGRRAIHLDGLGPRAANEVAETMHDLISRYPQVARRIRAFGASSKVTDTVNRGQSRWRMGRIHQRAYADASRQVQTIRLSAAKAKRYDEIVASLARDVESGFHPPGTGTVAAVMRHEFGHHLYWQAQDLTTDRHLLNRELETAIQDAIERSTGLGPAAQGSAEWAKARWSVMRTDVSQYATTNTDELMAESFAYVTSSDEPSQLASELVEILTRHASGNPTGGA